MTIASDLGANPTWHTPDSPIYRMPLRYTYIKNYACCICLLMNLVEVLTEICAVLSYTGVHLMNTHMGLIEMEQDGRNRFTKDHWHTSLNSMPSSGEHGYFI